MNEKALVPDSSQIEQAPGLKSSGAKPPKKRAAKKPPADGVEVDEARIIYLMLREPLPAEAIQRTKAKETKKGYDTTGIGYQYVIDRFNEVLGLDNWDFSDIILKTQEGKFQSGQPRWEITVKTSISIRVNGEWLRSRACVGSHVSMNHGDALKGAITNSFKKTASWWGVGREAYAGAIDDDSVTQEHGATTPVAEETVQEAVSPPKTEQDTPAGRPECPECGQPALMDSKFGEGQYCNPVWGGCKAQIVPATALDIAPEQAEKLPPTLDDIPIDEPPEFMEEAESKKKGGRSKLIDTALKAVAESDGLGAVGLVFSDYNKRLKGADAETFKVACTARAEYIKSGEEG